MSTEFLRAILPWLDAAVPLADLLGPFKAGIRAIVEGIVDGLEWTIELLMGLYVGLLERFMDLDPSQLAEMQSLWEVSMSVYFGVLALLALGFLGMMEIFPGNMRTDPYRFGERALLVTMGLFIVNPPGPAESTFEQGVFAWAFGLTNAIQDLYLAEASDVELVIDLASVSDAAGTIFATMIALLVMVVVLLLSIIPAVLIMGLRQVIIFGIYGLFPLIALLWIVDVGPLKYGNMVASMLFKAAAVLLALGVLVAGAMAASTGLIGASTSQTGDTASTVAAGPTVEVIGHDAPSKVATGVFSSHNEDGFMSTITTIIDVVGSSLVVSFIGLVVAFVVMKSMIGDTGGGGSPRRSGGGGRRQGGGAANGRGGFLGSIAAGGTFGMFGGGGSADHDSMGGEASVPTSPALFGGNGSDGPSRLPDGGDMLGNDDLPRNPSLVGQGTLSDFGGDDRFSLDGQVETTHDMGELDAFEGEGTVYDGSKTRAGHTVGYSVYRPEDGEAYMLANSELGEIVEQADGVESPGELYAAAERAAEAEYGQNPSEEQIRNATIPGTGKSFRDVKGELGEGALLERDYKRRGLEPIAVAGDDSVLNLDSSDQGIDGIAVDPDSGEVHVHVSEGKMSKDNSAVDGSMLGETVDGNPDQMEDQWIEDRAVPLRKEAEDAFSRGEISKEQVEQVEEAVDNIRRGNVTKEIHKVQDAPISESTVEPGKLSDKNIEHVTIHKPGHVIEPEGDN